MDFYYWLTAFIKQTEIIQFNGFLVFFIVEHVFFYKNIIDKKTGCCWCTKKLGIRYYYALKV